MSTQSDATKRDAIVNLIADGELARVATAEDAVSLPSGDDFVDLDRLELGIQTASADAKVSPHTIVPKSAVSAETWEKIRAAVEQ